MTKDWNLKQGSYPAQFAILLGLTATGMILSSLLAEMIWRMMVGGDIPTDTIKMLQPQYYNANMVIQGVSTFLVFFLPAMTVAAICYKMPNEFLGLNRRFNYQQLGLMALILLATIPLAGALGELNRIIPLPIDVEKKLKAIEMTRQAQEAAFIKIDSLYKYFLSLLIIAVLPAIFEELFFRSALQNILTRWFGSPWPAIIIASVIFSIIHLSYYGFLVRFSFGVILGLLFYYSKNVWVPIFFHFLVNGLQVTALYILTLKGIKRKPDLEEGLPLWWGIIGLGLLYILFKAYKKKSEEFLTVHDHADDTQSIGQHKEY